MDPITMTPAVNPQDTLLGVLQQIQALSAQPLVPDNPLMGAGAALQGFAAGTQGRANPALDMLRQQRQQQLTGLGTQAQIAGSMATISHQAETERHARANEKARADELRLRFGQDFLKSDSTDGRLFGAQELLKFGQEKFGVQAPPDLAVRLATKMLTPDEEKRVMGDLLAGVSPQKIQEQVPNFRVTDLPYYQQLVQNDDALKARGFTPRAQLAEDARKRQVAEHGDTLSMLGLSGTGRIAEDARNYIQTTLNKMPWEATPQEAADAVKRATAQRDARANEMLRLSRDRAEIAKKAFDLAAGKASIFGFEKVIKPLQKQASLIESLALMDDLVDKLPNLPPHGASLPAAKVAEWKRAWQNPTDPNLFTFKQLWGPIMIGQVDRGWFDEKGIRAMQAFEQQINVTQHPPSAQALHQFLGVLKASIQAQMQRTGQMSKSLPIPPEIRALIDPAIGGLTGSPALSELDKDY